MEPLSPEAVIEDCEREWATDGLGWVEMVIVVTVSSGLTII
jgi:hypothetical protein